MRYIRQQIVKNTVTDSEITDCEVIYPLFKNLMNSDINFRLDYVKHKSEDSFCQTCNHVRIIKIDEEKKTIDIRSFSNKFSYVIKDLAIDDIQQIVLCTDKTNLETGLEELDEHVFLDI